MVVAEDEAVNTAGCDTTTVAVVLHPFSSDTV
jgi:hypothetical protein